MFVYKLHSLYVKEESEQSLLHLRNSPQSYVIMD